MKKLLILTSIIICAFCAATLSAEETSSLEFKYYMHKIFDSYNHAEISHSLGKYDIADIHLRNMEESIAQAQKHIPGKNKDGSKLDKKLFLLRITKLQSMAADLRGAVKYKAADLSKSFSRETFNMCVTCHEEVKLEYLFRLPQRTTLFGAYMHKVSDHLDQARIYRDREGLGDRFKKQLKLITYYLDLIKTTSPDQGPSGVIMDRDIFTRRVEELAGKLQKDINDINGKKKIDLEGIRKDLNGLCVACHERERIR
jgi:cytochrome c553